MEHVALPALERYAREQMENGMVEEGWEVQRLDDAPFYPGWEEKWRREQGFLKSKSFNRYPLEKPC